MAERDLCGVTERVQFEAALRASDERWRAIFETSAVGIVTSDLVRRYVTGNRAFQVNEEDLPKVYPAYTQV